jgi:spore coat protein U-like protein
MIPLEKAMLHNIVRTQAPSRMALIAIALAAVAATPALAATATANLGVSATVTANCQISTTPVAFGNYDPVVANAATPLAASGTVSITCTKGSVPTLALGLGANASGSTRQMAPGAGADRLTYELYQPTSIAPNAACAAAATPGQVWGTSGAALFSPGAPAAATARSFNVCGVVPPNQTGVGVGSYSDTVVATVNF